MLLIYGLLRKKQVINERLSNEAAICCQILLTTENDREKEDLF